MNYLILTLQVCGILLIIALTVAAIMFILVLLDVRSITRRLKKEIRAATFLVDILDFLIGGFEIARRKVSESKFMAKFKRAAEIIKEGSEKNG